MSRETKPHDPTAAARSARRYAKAAHILGGITLDQEHADMLDAITAATGETATAWVRRMIREQAARS